LVALEIMNTNPDPICLRSGSAAVVSSSHRLRKPVGSETLILAPSGAFHEPRPEWSSVGPDAEGFSLPMRLEAGAR
jgi:hypothetical protein